MSVDLWPPRWSDEQKERQRTAQAYLDREVENLIKRHGLMITRNVVDRISKALREREYQGVRVETFRTLAARDAWAASMGYRSGRDMKALILHKKFGEVARHIVSVDMLRTG